MQATASATRLSVNLNKIALLRNARRTGVPNLLRFVELARLAGADGITLHPRPDERHIRRADVLAIAKQMQPWRPEFELNVEGNPDERFFDIIRAVRPEQCTLVPDAADALTSDTGWRLDDSETARLHVIVSRLHDLGCRVILFVDPDAAAVRRVPATGADGIEIYTGDFAAFFRRGDDAAILHACAAAASAANDAGLTVNIGHDLNLDNLPRLLAALGPVAEASIGHELTADALVIGFGPAVAAYKAALTTSISAELQNHSAGRAASKIFGTSGSPAQ